ncbi:uracil-DNA glycosylase [Verrucomicrobiaceae bacterium 227]
MAAPTILDYLHQLQNQGVTHVQVDDEARAVLRELYTRGTATKARKAPAPAPATTSTGSTATTSPSSASPDISSGIRATGNTPEEQIASLRQTAATWPPARALRTLRETLVFSCGNPQADLMLVGEAPGYHDELKGEPFVGPAGAKLDQILKAMGLSRDLVYISNVCKFRPATKNQTTNNRKPSPEELACSLPFIQAEIDVVKPKVIIALGASAAEGLLKQSAPVGQLREAWHQFQGIPLRVSFHPSYLLRQEDGLGEKRKVWEDMLAAMEKLGLPISEKQQGYFK